MTAAVDVRAVSHSYGRHVALRDVSLRVEPGILFGLLGPNGGGKTTLFRILSTLLRPSGGSAFVFGHNVATDPAEIRRRIGMVFQSPALDEELTIRENAATSAALYGLKGEALAKRVDRLARSFHIHDRAGHRVKTLSGGLKRRADLLRGLLHRPDLLLLDEPTNGLDPGARRAFWDTLAALRRTEGTTMIAATHLMEEAERCDQVAIINNGALIAFGTPAELHATLGSSSVWLEAADPVGLADVIQSRFGFNARIVGGSVQIEHEDPYAVLPRLHDAFGSAIDAATVRRPTLEDVFLHLTGRRIDDEEAPRRQMALSAEER